MPPPEATAQLYTTLQRYQLMLVLAGRRLWSGMSPTDFDGSWARIVPSLVTFTSGAQLAAAQAATAYVPTVLEETGQPDEPLARIRPRAFAGVASDGRSLPGLLEGAVVAAKRAATTRTVVDAVGLRRTRTTIRGLDGGAALELGQRWLEQALQSAVADAMRDATAANIAVRPNLGWVRMVNPPCCSRCAVLAGRWYRWNQGFLRHPGCDCVHIPSRENAADDYVTDANDLVKRGLITDLSKNQQERLSDGADLSKVLNESRDRWRQRMAADRKASKTWATNTPTPIPPGGVQNFLAHLTSQVDAANALRAAGIAE